jgi:CHAT domain-containing protein
MGLMVGVAGALALFLAACERPDDLKRLKGTYEKKSEEIRGESQSEGAVAKMNALTQEYGQALDGLLKKLLKKGKSEEATAVQKERDRAIAALNGYAAQSAVRSADKLIRHVSKGSEDSENAVPNDADTLTRALELSMKSYGPEHPVTAVIADKFLDLTEYRATSQTEAILQAVLKVYERFPGPQHLETAKIRVKVASVYAGEYEENGTLTELDKALSLLLPAILIYEATLGPNDPQTIKVRDKLSLIYRDYDEQKHLVLLARILVKIEQSLGPSHIEALKVCDHMTSVYEELSDSGGISKAERQKVEQLYSRVFKGYAKSLGPEDTNTARIHKRMISFTYDSDDRPGSLEYALQVEEEILGATHPETVSTRSLLASAYCEKGLFVKAEPCLRSVLETQEKLYGINHTNTTFTCSSLASIYLEMGDYAKAEQLLTRALRICEKNLVPNHPQISSVCSRLGSLHQSMGNQAKAREFYERSMEISQNRADPNGGGAEALVTQAKAFLTATNYVAAELFQIRALEMTEKTKGANDSSTADRLRELAWLYVQSRNYAKAEPLLVRALKIAEDCSKPTQPSHGRVFVPSYLPRFATCEALGHLATVYELMGEYSKAESLLIRALEPLEHSAAVSGMSSSCSVQWAGQLASVYKKMGSASKSEVLFERARVCFLNLEPEMDSETACTLMGNAYRGIGDYAKAAVFFRQALKYCDDDPEVDRSDMEEVLKHVIDISVKTGDRSLAMSLLQRSIGDLKKKAKTGTRSADYIDLCRVFSYLAIDAGCTAEASIIANLAVDAQEKNLNNILSFTSEQQRTTFQDNSDHFTLLATLGQAVPLAQTVLRCKSIVLDSLLEDRLVAEVGQDPTQREEVDRLTSAKQQLMHFTLNNADETGKKARQKRMAKEKELSAEVEQIEAELAKRFVGLGRARRALRVTVQKVQHAMGQGQALIEFLRFSNYIGKETCTGSFLDYGTFPHQSTYYDYEEIMEDRYGAVVILPDGQPTWVLLGNAGEIEKTLSLYQKCVRDPVTSDQTLSVVLQTLYRQIWTPVCKQLPPDIKTVILSPDAELNFLSFATLLAPDNKFLCEKYSIRHVASGRDLLLDFKSVSQAPLEIYANPDFNAQPGSPASPSSSGSLAVAMRSLDMREISSLSLPPLPGTQQEGMALAAQFKKAGVQAELFLGKQATEAQLRRINSPRILHLATHGFFLPDAKSEGPAANANVRGMSVAAEGEGDPASLAYTSQPQTVAPKNPMHRSGLALAGAQQTFSAWARGEVPPTDNDGIVTAEEVGGMKLTGTWLVVLSACETGVGEARAGEGVLGLRRGFIQAGAKNLLMTLWPVADEETVKLMTDFYAAAQSTGNAPEALANMQRDSLVKLRQEKGLQFAVNRAGPFIMSTQGSLK